MQSAFAWIAIFLELVSYQRVDSNLPIPIGCFYTLQRFKILFATNRSSGDLGDHSRSQRLSWRFLGRARARRQADRGRRGGALPPHQALGGLSLQAIAYCLREAGVQLSDVDHIAFNQDSRANLMRKIGYFLIKRPNINLVLSRLRNRRARAGLPVLLEQAFPGEIRARGIPPRRASSGASVLGIPCLSLRSGGRCFDRWIRRFLERGLGRGERDAKSQPMAESIFRIRSASSIRRSRNISAFRIMATSTR